MNKRVLGRIGIEVSEISFGTVSLGLPYGIGIKGQEDMLSESGSIELLQSALDKGINYFDTARGYGCSEERLGKAFKDRRKDVVICTKYAFSYDGNKQLFPDKRQKEVIDTSIKESLAALQTDYIDVYMIHNASLKVLSNQAIVEAFRSRLKTIAGFGYVPEPLPMRNTKGAVVYYLFFASPKKTGGKIVTDIFNTYKNRGSV